MENLIYSKKKAWFEEELSNVPENAIAFIGDTKEIYAQGEYFGGNPEANVGAVDTDDFVEEPDLAKYLTTKPQSFTDEEKQQVKDNLGINAEDFDLSDYAKKITVVDHGTEDVEIEIGPNVLHKWGEVATLTITLATPENQTEYNEYMFEFLSGATATTLSLPDTVEWVEKPSIEPNYIYQISIVNNVGVFISAYNL